MTVRRAAVTAAVLAVAALTAPGAGSATPAAERPGRLCAGKVPTVVATHGTAHGTPGRDVILATRSVGHVVGGGGDDLICLRTRYSGIALVEPGPGDDVIRAHSTYMVSAVLAEGRDTYIGGNGMDWVRSGVRGHRNRDRIRLGGGDDSVSLVDSTDHAKAVVRGGAGSDEIDMQLKRRGSLVVNAATQEAVRGERRFATWSGFEEYRLEAWRQAFLGSDRDDVVTFDRYGSVVGHGGAGDDTVQVEFGYRRGTVPVLDGGDGADTLSVHTWYQSVVASLVTDRLDAAQVLGGPMEGFGFSGFEGLAVSAPTVVFPEDAGWRSRVELVGDESDNTLQAYACDVVLRGGAGDDRLSVGLDVDGDLADPSDGPGCDPRSEAHGDEGLDTCVADVRLDCEA